jgi:predicted nucleotide-binding protein
MFTTDKLAKEFSWAGAQPVVLMAPPTHAQKRRSLDERIDGKITALESIKERLELYEASNDRAVVTEHASPARTNKAFLVHGRDEAIRESVARFLGRVGVDPVILHEQATSGRTIVEKLEHYSDVDFAVVLLTPDDFGGMNDQSGKQQPRARQNVIMELGYFVGKLGRKKVCAMYQGPLELPSDYLGVVYVQLDSTGGWQLQLARELKSAGFDISVDALLGGC